MITGVGFLHLLIISVSIVQDSCDVLKDGCMEEKTV